MPSSSIPSFCDKFLLDGLPRLGAQPPHALLSVVARERCQVHAGDRPQQPRRLPVFLHCSPRHLCLRASLHGACVHAHFLHPVQIEGNPGIGQQQTFAQRGDRPACGSPRRDFVFRSVCASDRRTLSRLCVTRGPRHVLRRNCTAANPTMRIPTKRVRPPPAIRRKARNPPSGFTMAHDSRPFTMQLSFSLMTNKTTLPRTSAKKL